MPKITNDKREERRTQILEAARRCFLREGLNATTMNDIIQESGLSTGAVYNYFATKEDLTLSALSTSLSELRDILDPLFGHNSPLSPDLLLEEIISAIALFSQRDGFDLRRLALLGWGEAQHNPKFRQIISSYYLGFLDQLTAAAKIWQRSGRLSATADPSEIAKTIFSCVLGFIVQSAILGEITPAILKRGMQDFCRSLAKQTYQD